MYLILCVVFVYIYTCDGIIHFDEISSNRTQKDLENPGIDPGTSHMLSERSTI